MRTVTLKEFGKDHWSLLGYVECCCVEKQCLDKRRIRCNNKRHPIHWVNGNDGVGGWQPSCGTRLHGYFDAAEEDKPKFRLSGHDDWDCLNDLEAAGLLEVISEANAAVQMTDLGNKVAALLREFKTKGGTFAQFSPAAISLCTSLSPASDVSA